MASLGNAKVAVEIDLMPLCEVVCLETTCRFNSRMACRMKKIVIGDPSKDGSQEGHECYSYEPRESERGS